MLRRMLCWITLVFRLVAAVLKSRSRLLLENLALRHQLQLLTRTAKPPRWTLSDRFLWVCLSRIWSPWKIRLQLVQPATVIRWHRRGFGLFWKWKSRSDKPGRKTIATQTIALIREMSLANPLWGAPRIHGELLKLGLTVAQRTVTKYMVRRSSRAPSQNWKNFLRNHLGHMVSVDFFTVPTLRF